MCIITENELEQNKRKGRNDRRNQKLIKDLKVLIIIINKINIDDIKQQIDIINTENILDSNVIIIK